MWGSIKAILQGLGAVLTLVAKAVERKRVERDYRDAQNAADRIASDPSAEWMRRFKEQRSPSPAKADSGKPGADA